MKAVPHVTGRTGSGRSTKLTSCHMQNTHGETTWLKEHEGRMFTWLKSVLPSTKNDKALKNI